MRPTYSSAVTKDFGAVGAPLYVSHQFTASWPLRDGGYASASLFFVSGAYDLE